MNQDLRNFVLAVLDDDNGISEEAWEGLMELLHNQGEMEFIGELVAQADTQDDRFFIQSR
jgi:hypothetical protein